MAVMGRPTIYSKELVDKICQRLADGETLRAICRDDGMPVLATVTRWLNESDKQYFKAQYADARVAQANHLFDELKEIADDSTGDVQRDRLRVDTRKWYLSKLAPKIYGDKLDMTTNGKDLPTPILGYVSTDNSNQEGSGPV